MYCNRISQTMNIEKIVTDCLNQKRAEKGQSMRKHRSASLALTHDQPTFKPHIHELPVQIYQPSSKTYCSREQIVERLLNGGKDCQQSLARKKQEIEEQAFEQTCTFHPDINTNSKRILKTECTTDEDPFERLYSNAMNRTRMMESLNYTSLAREKQNYSFHPQINHEKVLHSENHNGKPLFQRVDQIVQEKRELLKKLKDEQEKEGEMKKPKIVSVNSENLLKEKEGFKKSILERVSSYMKEKKEKEEEMMREGEKYELRECTFKPEINSTSLMGDFQQRQSEYLKKLESKMTSRYISNSFKPEINKISNILTREREEESWEQKLDRLCSDPTRRDKMDDIEREAYQECTFEPEINLISKCLQAQHVAHRCDHTPKQQHYDFKPKINKMSNYIVQINKTSREKENTDRQETLNQVKMEMEYKEMKECTFKPRINQRGTVKGKAAVESVRGFEGFKKKMEKIGQMKEERKMREEEVFAWEKKYDGRSRSSSTRPQEFKLSKGYGRIEEMRKEQQEKFESECPFKPVLNHLR